MSTERPPLLPLRLKKGKVSTGGKRKRELGFGDEWFLLAKSIPLHFL